MEQANLRPISVTAAPHQPDGLVGGFPATEPALKRWFPQELVSENGEIIHKLLRLFADVSCYARAKPKLRCQSCQADARD